MLEPVTESPISEPMGAHGKRGVEPTPPQPLSPSISELPDLLLVERARGKDTRAFETLMRRYNRRLFRIARSVIPDDEAAETVVQEAYLLAFTDLERYEPAGKFGVWLARLAYNQALAIRRSVRPAIPGSGDPFAGTEYDTDAPLTNDSDTEAGDDTQAREALEGAIDGLPEVFRPVFVLRAIEKISGIETAACLGINETTVRTRLYRAQRRLNGDQARQLTTERNGVFEVTGNRSDRIIKRVFSRLNGLAPTQESA
jgi:RNA polymerase sigma-70 factor (ECF subfamily)